MKSSASSEVSWATGCAVVLSLATIAMALISVPIVYHQVAEIRRELEADMAEYRGLSDELWSELVVLGRDGDVAHQRQRRDAYGQAYDHHAADSAAHSGYGEAKVEEPLAPPMEPAEPIIQQEELIVQAKCNCQAAENKCPPGPPGPKGSPGQRGEDGANGAAGDDGRDAADVQEQAQTFGECWRCPAGPPGIPGAPGNSGARGMRGARGQAGCAGRNGSPGPSGAPGDMGPSGEPGKLGPQGDIGSPGNAYKHLTGIKGAPGPIGEEGEAGRPGLDGEDGEEGDVGPQGPAGPPGEPGRPGPEGQEGKMGKHGNDARYCPCPQRSRFLGTEEGDGYGEEAPEAPPVSEIEINEGYGHHIAADQHGEDEDKHQEEGDGYGQAPMLEPVQDANAGQEEIPSTTTAKPIDIVRDDGYGHKAQAAAPAGDSYGQEAQAAPPAPVDDGYGSGSPPAAAPPAPAATISFVAVDPSYGAADIGTPELEHKTHSQVKLISRGGKPQPAMVPIRRMGYGRYRNRKA